MISIERRFRGPPDSGNGGYVCGLLGKQFDGPAEVTLRAPPPLETPLQLLPGRLMHGDKLIAEAAPAKLDLDVPKPVSLEVAQKASAKYPWLHEHIFPTCFVCGPQNDQGLHIFAGPVEGSDLFAAPWTSQDAAPELTWAALDCPGGVACMHDKGKGYKAVLGRLKASLEKPVRPGVPHVVMAWVTGPKQGRKMFSGTAIFTAHGELCARAAATWIEI
jgi:hypothetical protein